MQKERNVFLLYIVMFNCTAFVLQDAFKNKNRRWELDFLHWIAIEAEMKVMSNCLYAKYITSLYDEVWPVFLQYIHSDNVLTKTDF